MPIQPIQCGGSSGGSLNCSTDSVTICPGSQPIPVIVCQDDPLAVCFTLDCSTDSIMVCPPDNDAPFHVILDTTDIDIRDLNYNTDSVSNWPDMENVASLSSTTPLGIGGVFTSPWILVDRRADIKIGCKTNQDGVLHTQHSNDNGVTIIRDSTQPVTANKGEFLSFHPRGQYFRVIFDNNSGSVQSFFELSTEINAGIYGVTQSLFSAPLGRESFGIQARSVLYDYQYDETAIITPYIRDLVTVSRASLFADAFNGAVVDENLWATTATGSGSTVQTPNFGLDLATGATVNSTVKFESTVRGRFIAGNLQSCRSGIYMPDAGTVNNKRRWGAYDDDNGFFWELEGSILYAVGRLGGVDTKIPSASWNKINTFVLTAGAVHSYEVSYFADTAWFILDGQVHHIMAGGIGLRGSYPNRFENINFSGASTNTELFVLGSFNQRYGPDLQQPRHYNIVGAATTILKNQAGHLYRVNVNGGSGLNTAVIYNNTVGSGNTIGTIDVNKNQGTIDYGIDFSTGLTVVTTGVATDLTVVFD